MTTRAYTHSGLNRTDSLRGTTIALVVIGVWCVGQWLLLDSSWRGMVWLLPVLVLWQTHLYTGLFITAHDAMHRTVSGGAAVNNAIGTAAALLFAFNWFPRLLTRHHRHHKNVATENDPDYHASHRFWPWYFSFLKNYITWWQILLMALLFNVLKQWFDPLNVIVLWMLPSVLSTLQLFYFGTFLPHKGEFDATNPHHATSLPRNHVVAFVTCYFFGYHYEHHEQPNVPWWKLHELKDSES